MKLVFYFIYLTSVTLLYSKVFAQEKLYANEFPLSDVKLLDGPFKQARDLNIHTLLQYKVDRLLAPYRKEAGLTPKDSSYTNWEGLDGHIAGHYLSAMAMNVASTNNAECKRRMLNMISELKACKEANTKNHPGWGVGYVGGVPGLGYLTGGLHIMQTDYNNDDFKDIFVLRGGGKESLGAIQIPY